MHRHHGVHSHPGREARLEGEEGGGCEEARLEGEEGGGCEEA